MDPLVGLFGPCSDEAEIPEMPEVLPPEIEEGNVEYKLKLVDPSDSRFEHLVTQLKWRLQEGEGEAIYEIGVEDNGLLAGLRAGELEASLNTLGRMAERLGASISVIREKHVESGEEHRRVAEVLVRKVPDNQQFIDLRLAVLGNVDAGKSTLLGVLTQGELDNGWGRARLNLFRHLHEIQTGRTSSISHEILGFNSRGEVVNYSDSRDAEEICENSTKLITLIDLCGHHKYLKTTIFGLTGYSPDFAMLVVSANTGIVGTTKEHLGFALALGVPIFVVISKIDMCRKAQVERTVKQLEKILKGPGCKKVPFRVDTEDDAVTAASTFHTERGPIMIKMARSREEMLKSMGITRSQENIATAGPSVQNTSSLEDVGPLSTQNNGACAGPLNTMTSRECMGSSLPTKSVIGKNESVMCNADEYESICPIFSVSSVSGKNLELLTKFLNVLPPLHSTKEREQFMQELAEHQIDEVYDIQGVGQVAGGTVLRGTIKEGDRLLLGPADDGRFQPVSIATIQRNRLASRMVSAGQSCSLSLGNNTMPVRKGMVLVSPELNPQSCIEFEADIYVLFHTNYICKGFQTVIHVGNVRQTAIITRTSKAGLRTNEKAVVQFRFINRPEFIRVGSRLLFREGRTKGMGEVTKIFPIDPTVQR